MRTSALIDLLASGAGAANRHSLEWRFASALAVAATATLVLLVVRFGLHPALGELITLPAFWIKSAFSAALVSGGIVATARLARPGVLVGRATWLLATPLLVLWALATIALVQAEPTTRIDLLLGQTWRRCPYNIAMLSLPTFVASAWVLRGLAPTNLRRAGAAAGLLSGALGALMYGLHCPELATPFLSVWYVIGIAAPTVVGGWLGPRFLRW